jgi:uncharacterized protein
MKRSELQRLFKNGRALIAKETYAIVKTRRVCAGAMVVIRDPYETTCVVDEAKLRKTRNLGVDGGWKLITFDMVLPFNLVGFFAQISGTLADAGVSLLAISAYSRDHVLVKSKDLDKAVKSLEKLGMSVQRL